MSWLQSELNSLKESLKGFKNRGEGWEGREGDIRIYDKGNNEFSLEIKTAQGWGNLYSGMAPLRLNPFSPIKDSTWMTPPATGGGIASLTINHDFGTNLVHTEVFIKTPSTGNEILNLSNNSLRAEKPLTVTTVSHDGINHVTAVSAFQEGPIFSVSSTDTEVNFYLKLSEGEIYFPQSDITISNLNSIEVRVLIWKI